MQALKCTDCKTCRHTTFLINVLAVPGFKGYLFNQSAQQIGNNYCITLIRRNAGFLACDCFTYFYGFWIVSKNLAADTILQRSNNRTAVGIIFGVGCKNKLQIERES